VIRHVRVWFPNIIFALSDKDTTEINAVHVKLPNAKHQLCYWHAIQYLEERLADDKLPAKYNSRIAHCVCPFINPTWAPGITLGWLEDGVHEDDAECEKPDEEEVHEVISTLFHGIYCLPLHHPGNHSSHLLASSFCFCEQQGSCPPFGQTHQ
jgi:hypothetical protein